MNTRTENALWTWPLLVIGTATLGVGAWTTTGGLKYIAPGVIAMLAALATIVMAFAGRRKDTSS